MIGRVLSLQRRIPAARPVLISLSPQRFCWRFLSLRLSPFPSQTQKNSRRLHSYPAVPEGVTCFSFSCFLKAGFREIGGPDGTHHRRYTLSPSPSVLPPFPFSSYPRCLLVEPLKTGFSKPFCRSPARRLFVPGAFGLSPP